MKKFILFNIGCLECDVNSDLVGVFDSESKANSISKQLSKKFRNRGGGHNSFAVFELQKLNKINPSYLITKK